MTMTSCQRDTKIRQVDLEVDLPMIHGWWEGHGLPSIGTDMLPSTGLIVEREGRPHGCVFIYRSDSRLAWFEWLTVDPDLGPRDRLRAVHTLIEAAIAWSMKMGYLYMITSVRHEGLMRTLEKHGFVKTDEGMTNMLVYMGDE